MARAADDTQSFASAKEEPYGKKYFALFVYLTYLVLPSVATTIFLAFPTINVNPSGVKGLPYASVYLTSDYRIEAGSERDKLVRLWATAMIFVYPVGIPVRLFCSPLISLSFGIFIIKFFIYFVCFFFLCISRYLIVVFLFFLISEFIPFKWKLCFFRLLFFSLASGRSPRAHGSSSTWRCCTYTEISSRNIKPSNYVSNAFSLGMF